MKESCEKMIILKHLGVLVPLIISVGFNLQCAAASKIECNSDHEEWLRPACVIAGFTFEAGHLYEVDDMEKMKRLEISNSNTTHLPMEMLNNFINLIKFKVTTSTLEQVDDGLKLMNLWHLNLTGNRIERISVNAFAGCPNLSEIILKMNVLASVPGGIFAAQPGLMHVDLSSNKLTNLPGEIFSQNPIIGIIKLQSNSLEELSMDVFGNLTRLKELDVSNNYLHKFLPSERFINMHGESSILDMSNNLLASLDLRNIRASNIIVNSNYLRQVSIGEGCRELFAKNNEIADIAIGASTATLEMLQMNHNKLGDNLMSICECQNLKSVFLAHNNISNIGFCFSRAGQLKEINLSRNNLSHLDYGYFSTDFLETLDLSYNAFEVIDENVLSLFRSLEYLYLDGNHLSDFPEDLDKILPHLRLIGLSHNRFQCKKLLMLYRRWQTTNRIAFNVDEPMPTNMTNIRGNICYKEKIEQIPEENIEEEPSLNHLNGSNVAFWKELQALRKKLENSNAIVEKKENISELPEKSHLIMQATTEITSGLDFSTDAPEVINETTKNATDAKEVEDNFTATGNTTILDGIFKSLSSIEGKLRELGSLLSGRNSTTSPFQSNDDRANVRTFATISTILAVIVLILGAAILWYNYHSYFYYKKLRDHNAEALRTFQTL